MSAVLVLAASADLYGSDRTLLSMLPAMAQRHHVIVAFPVEGPAVELASGAGADTLTVPDFVLRRRYLSRKGILTSVRNSRRAIRQLKAHHRLEPFDVLYVNTLAVPIGPILKRRLGVPYVLHVHESPTQPSWLPPLLVRWCTAGADLVICNSEHTRSWLLRQRPALAGRALVVHNGVRVPEAILPQPAERFRISCVGRIHPGKGHAILLEALRLARDRGRNWEVQLFGDTLAEHEAIRSDLQAFVRDHGLDDRVKWRGFEPDVALQYVDADVAVVPSVVPEGFSLVCAEAHAVALPVVATGHGGASEVVAHQVTGYIVPPADPEALVEALSALEHDPDKRRQMGQAGRERVLHRFTEQSYAFGVVAAVETVLGGRSQAHDERPRRGIDRRGTEDQ